MPMSTKASMFSLALGLFLLCHGTLAQQQQQQGQSYRQFQDRSECRIERLQALEPTRSIVAEAGSTEYWDQKDEQLDCAGVTVTRTTIQSKGLLMPSFSNAPRLVYILRGEGFLGAIFPGCPETYQSFQQSEQQEEQTERGRGRRIRDEHQKIRGFRQGDVFALPPGFAHWCYNEGDTPVVAITVFDTSSGANQLDRNHRQFLLAGRLQRGQQPFFGKYSPEEISHGDNLFRGLDLETLAEVLGVSNEVARKLQSEDDRRGHIVFVEQGLLVIRPPKVREQQQSDESESEQMTMNGLEESLCSVKIRENIDNPSKADVYTPRGGRLTSLNSQKLPLLAFLKLSALRGVLYKNGILSPRWNINAHTVAYITRGRGRVQIVANNGKRVFDAEVRQGQLIVIPQYFAELIQASSEGLEWISFKTDDNAIADPLAGETSTLQGLPLDVIANSFGISREEARILKQGRSGEQSIFTPQSSIRIYV